MKSFCYNNINMISSHLNVFAPVAQPVVAVAQRYRVTSDTLGREFDPGKRDFFSLKN